MRKQLMQGFLESCPIQLPGEVRRIQQKAAAVAELMQKAQGQVTQMNVELWSSKREEFRKLPGCLSNQFKEKNKKQTDKQKSLQFLFVQGKKLVYINTILVRTPLFSQVSSPLLNSGNTNTAAAKAGWREVTTFPASHWLLP